MIAWKHRVRRVRQVLVYCGHDALRMPDSIDFGDTGGKYTMVDIRDLDAAELMSTGRAADLALAMLARGGAEQLRRILRQAEKLGEVEKRRVLAHIAELSGLRRLDGKVKMEMKRMGLIYDFENNVILRDIRDEAMAAGQAKGMAEGKAEGKAEGMAEVLQSQLAYRFGRLPKWAASRIGSAGAKQLEDWARKVLAADSLEAVLGPPAAAARRSR